MIKYNFEDGVDYHTGVAISEILSFDQKYVKYKILKKKNYTYSWTDSLWMILAKQISIKINIMMFITLFK